MFNSLVTKDDIINAARHLFETSSDKIFAELRQCNLSEFTRLVSQDTLYFILSVNVCYLPLQSIAFRFLLRNNTSFRFYSESIQINQFGSSHFTVNAFSDSVFVGGFDSPVEQNSVSILYYKLDKR